MQKQTGKQPPVVKGDLTGKTVCVLGANTGIGFETVKHFASMNAARIILACRSAARGEEAIHRLKAETGYTKGELWILDLGDFASVTRFGNQWEKDGGRLDILVANAAMETRKYTTTKDGWETTVQVNYIATSLTILLLLPTILRTAQQHATLPRIVVVSSGLHYDVTIEQELRDRPGQILKKLSSPEWSSTCKRLREQYAITKLMEIIFVRALTEHLGPAASIIVNAVDPAFSVSGLRRDIHGATAIMLKWFESAVALSTEEGSRRLVFAAVGLPHAPNTLRGQYLDMQVISAPSDFITGPVGVQVQKDLWEETLALLGSLDPRISAIAGEYLSTY
ncbi:short-chain dehydrogenase [Mycena epipterygia]|nr:short-chain dehydrogenase [Mycena epipterygia]